MRLVRLLGMVLTILAAGLLLGPPAGAQPPFRLSNYVTDNAGVLTSSGRTAVTAAVDRLYADRRIRLWVVYVENFSGQSALNWAQRTTRTSELGNYDALLAVATTGREYAFLVPSAMPGVSEGQVDNVRRYQIEPALHDGDYSGAAVAAANGLKPVTQFVESSGVVGHGRHHRHRRRGPAGGDAPPQPAAPRRRAGRGTPRRPYQRNGTGRRAASGPR